MPVAPDGVTVAVIVNGCSMGKDGDGKLTEITDGALATTAEAAGPVSGK